MVLHEITIADRPAKTEAEWPIDVKKINELPATAVVAIVLSVDLMRLTEGEFKAVASWFEQACGKRRNSKMRGSNNGRH